MKRDENGNYYFEEPPIKVSTFTVSGPMYKQMNHFMAWIKKHYSIKNFETCYNWDKYTEEYFKTVTGSRCFSIDDVTIIFGVLSGHFKIVTKAKPKPKKKSLFLSLLRSLF